MTTERFLTIPEAAERAGVWPNTIRHWCSTGRLVPVGTAGRDGRMLLFRAADVDAAAAPAETSPTLDGTPVTDEESAA